jgi:DNA-binding transcriptional LysR family regulator
VLSSNQTDVTIDACLRGLGIGRFLEYQVQALVRARRLRRLLAAHEPQPLPIRLVYPHARLLSGNVRAFVAFAMPRLKAAVAGG